MWHKMTPTDARPSMHALPDIAGYDVSQRVRKRIEEIFGWGKDVGPIRKNQISGQGPSWLSTVADACRL